MGHYFVYFSEMMDDYVAGTLWVDTFTLFALYLATNGGSVRMFGPRYHQRESKISSRNTIS